MLDATAGNRERLAALVKRERESYAANFPRSRAAFAGAGRHLLGGVPMTWMRMWPGGFPRVPGGGPRRPAQRHRRPRATSTSAWATPARWPGTRPRRWPRPSPGAIPSSAAATTMLPTEDAAWVAAELARRFGRAAVELHADRHRRQPLGDPARAPADRAAEDPRLQLLLPRHGGRVVHRRRPRRPARPAPGNVGAPVDPARDDPGRGVQRRRGARAGAGPRRRGRGADGAGTDQHRHRAARRRLPRGRCAS